VCGSQALEPNLWATATLTASSDSLIIIAVADAGECVESFDGVAGYTPSDFGAGEVQYGVRSVDNCEAACRRRSSCTRFVVVTDTQLTADPNRVCYLFTARLATFVEQPGATVYFRRRCLRLDTCAAAITTTSESAGSGSELSMGWVDPWVGLGWVHYSKRTKNLKGLF